jgi:hypothetical protein
MVATIHVIGVAMIDLQPIEPLGSQVKYIAKGVRPDAASYFQMTEVPQGFVSGRGRAFVSRSLSVAARKAANGTRKPASKGAAPRRLMPDRAVVLRIARAFAGKAR